MSFTIIAGIIGLITTILWLIIGWRAMKAHESLAESTALLHLEVSRLRTNLSQGEKHHSRLPKLNE